MYPLDILPNPTLSEEEQRWIEHESGGSTPLEALIMRRETMIDYIAENGGSYGVNPDVELALDATVQDIAQEKRVVRR